MIQAFPNPRALAIGKSKDGAVTFKKIFTISAIAILSQLYTNNAHANNTAPTVLEIYTSRGCPACPPADQNFKRTLRSNPDMIGLSCHVTYFNKGRGTDIFSNAFCDARQAVYKLALGTKRVYTPMMIINGRSVTTGTTYPKLKDGMRHAGKSSLPPVSLTLKGQYLDIRLPRAQLSQDADIWLFEYIKTPQQAGYGGYLNTVSNITKLMRWNGKAMNMAFPVNPGMGKGFAVIVQDFKSGIITAGKAE